MSHTLLDCCGGSGAVSLQVAGHPGLMQFMGGKRGVLGKRIAARMPPISAVVLTDAGPWGRAWATLTRDATAVADRMEALVDQHEDAGGLFDALRMEGQPTDPVSWAATFLVLQALNYRGRPVQPSADGWTTHGLDTTRAFGRAGTDRFGAVNPQLPVVIERVRQLERLRVPLLAVAGPARLPAGPLYRFVVYVDPPYQGTTCGYGADLPREQVVALAVEARERGAHVLVSEQAPVEELVARGWRTEEITNTGGPGASLNGAGRAARRPDWVTWAAPRRPVLQLSTG